MNIHKKALMVFGFEGRLQKLRMEAVELAHAIDRFDEDKGSIGDVLHEYYDCLYVFKSIKKRPLIASILRNGFSKQHEVGEEGSFGAKQKLKIAIAEKEDES